MLIFQLDSPTKLLQLFSGPGIFIWICLQCLLERMLGFWLGLHWIYWLIWSRLTSWYWAFQSRIQLSLYLSLHLSMPSLNFLSTQSCFTVYMSFVGLILNYFIVFDTIVNWKYQFPIVLFYYIEIQLVLYIYILSFHFTKFTYWF